MTYKYSGRVFYFDTCVCNRWTAKTTASSVAKARSNLTYRYKKENNYAPGAKIELPDAITEE